MSIYFLNDKMYFPPIQQATEEGVVAVGGDLTSERLLLAYRSGIFPWFSESDPIIWWSPDPRFVLMPNEIKVSKSMRQLFKKNAFRVTFDTAFADVIHNCQQSPRVGQDGTWITNDMVKAYTHLHQQGYAHSVEVWQDKRLVGGLYGISLGRAFFGESMFMKESNASKYGFITLVESLQALDFDLIDAQVYTKHLESLGARDMSRDIFAQRLEKSLQHETLLGPWTHLI